jgi:hypothetical protein
MAVTKIHGGTQIQDLTITNSKIKNNELTNEKINVNANIDISKLNTTNADFDGSGKIKDGVISNSNIASNASIALSKLASLGVNKALITDGSGVITVSNVTSVELSYLSGVTSSVQVQLDSKLPLAGGTLSGDLDLGGHYIKNVASPVNANDAATKSYVDSKLGGLSWQEPVIAIIDETNLPLTPNIGDRYLINNGTHVNNIAQYTTSGWIFIAPSANWAVFEQTNDQGWVYNAENTNNFKWVQFTGTGMIDAGTGLEKVGNVLNVKLGAGIKEMPTDEVGIDLAPNGGLELTSELSDGQLKVKYDNITLGVDNNGYLYLKDNAVTTSKIADLSITASKLGNIVGNGLIGSNGSIIQVDTGYIANKIPQYSSNGYLGIGKANPTAMLDVNGDLKVSGSIYIGSNRVDEGIEVREKAYGDGTTTQFTLSDTPISDSSVKVYVNGLLFSAPEDYSISGSVITFVEAPAASSIIQFIYKKS